MEKREIEEILELIWTLREERTPSLKIVLELTNEKDPEQILSEMRRQNLIDEKEGILILTARGEKYAEAIVRRHRLAERLFRDVFSMSEGTFEKEACTWEHVLSEGVTDHVCSFLGHPRVCPHNKPIPRGRCCYKYLSEKSLPPLVQPLPGISIGRRAKIVYILPSIQSRLRKLTALGLIPGAQIRLKQKKPALVVLCEGTTIAIDFDVASEIYAITLDEDYE
jgi:DtxR family Mn-dependent transcriptional regulator